MSDRLVDGAAPDALGADSSASHLPIFAYNFDTLKIHFELATGDARDLGTNTPQVLRFTTRFNRITDLGLLATNLTLAGHGRGSFLFFIAQSDFCSRLQQKLSPQGVGVLHLVRCGNPVWILKGCVEARSIPVDLMSATPKQARVVNFGGVRGTLLSSQVGSPDDPASQFSYNWNGFQFLFNAGRPNTVASYLPESPFVKALMLSEYKQLEVTEVPDPECGPNDVLVKVAACGICGSDIHGYDGSSGRRIPPLIMGHEAAGEVVAVGELVSDFSPGMRVTFDSMVSCGVCDFCRKGHRNLCDQRRVLGVSCGEYRRHGAFAELIAVPQHIVYRLPDSLSYEHAALVEAVSVAVHAVNRTPHELGDSAVVVGTGMIGLLVVQALKAAGFGKVIAVDLAEEKLKVAADLGADETYLGNDPELIEKIYAATDGKGANVAMEVVGATSTVKTAIEAVRKGGTVTLVGNLSPNVELPLQSVVTRELNLLGTCGCNGEYPECISLMEQGRINVEPLISQKIALSDAPSWFERLYEGEAGLMKVVVQPQLV